MNERYRELLEKAGKRLDLVLLAAGAVLLVVAIYFLYREQDFVAPPTEQPSPLGWDVRIPLEVEELPEPAEGEAEHFERFRRQFIRPNPLIEEDETARILVEVNPFSRSAVQERAQAADAIMDDFRQADRHFRDGNYEDAAGLVESILARNPQHQQTLRLQERIEEALAEAEAGEEDETTGG